MARQQPRLGYGDTDRDREFHGLISELYNHCTAGEQCTFTVAGGYPLVDAAGRPISRRAPRRSRQDGRTAWNYARIYFGDDAGALRVLDSRTRKKHLDRVLAREHDQGVPEHASVLRPRFVRRRDVERHVRGEHSIAVRAGDRARRLSFDLDRHDVDEDRDDPWTVARANDRVAAECAAIVRELESDGVAPVIQRTPSKGYHVDAYASRPVETERLRAYGLDVAKRAGVECEVYPWPGRQLRAPCGAGMVLCVMTADGPVPDRASVRYVGGPRDTLVHLANYILRAEQAEIPDNVIAVTHCERPRCPDPSVASLESTAVPRGSAPAQRGGSHIDRSFPLSSPLPIGGERVMRRVRALLEHGVTEPSSRNRDRWLVLWYFAVVRGDSDPLAAVAAWCNAHPHSGSRSRDFRAETLAECERTLRVLRSTHRVVALPADPVAAAELDALPADWAAVADDAPDVCRPEVRRLCARLVGFVGQTRALSHKSARAICGGRRPSVRQPDGSRSRPWAATLAIDYLRDQGVLLVSRAHKRDHHGREYLISAPIQIPTQTPISPLRLPVELPADDSGPVWTVPHVGDPEVADTG